LSGRILAGFLAVLLMMVAGAAEPINVVQAKDILENISLGLPVEYDNVIVEGDLDLSELELPTVALERDWFELYIGYPDYEMLVYSPIRITNSIIKGFVNLNGANLQNDTDLRVTTFEGPVYLIGSKFNQTAFFQYATFKQIANFGSATFNQTANFRFATFYQNANFESATFNQIADFSGTHSDNTKFNKDADFRKAAFDRDAKFAFAWFNRDADFESAIFGQYADFALTDFNKDAKFSGVRFSQKADLSGVGFNQAANFEKAEFNQTASFWLTKFRQNANFRLAKFNQTISFSATKFDQIADFGQAQFNQEAHFEDARLLHAFFNNSQFFKEVFFDNAWINGTFSLYRTRYDKLNIRWNRIHDLAYDDTAYHLLIQNFNKLGFFDDASECQYSYRYKHMWERWRDGDIDRGFFDFLAWLTYGFGQRPVRPLGWALLFILIGGIFFTATNSITCSKESAGKPENRPDPNQHKEDDQKSCARKISIWGTISHSRSGTHQCMRVVNWLVSRQISNVG